VILVVDDNADNVRLMQYLLEARGHSVVLAGDGAEGVERTRDLRPDVVLMDIQMPGMDGFEALKLIRAEEDTADTTVVAVTALAMVGDHDQVMAAGFDGYIAKPITPDAFVDQVEAFR
jgi:two-component system, cell cycle response regulator